MCKAKLINSIKNSSGDIAVEINRTKVTFMLYFFSASYILFSPVTLHDHPCWPLVHCLLSHHALSIVAIKIKKYVECNILKYN